MKLSKIISIISNNYSQVKNLNFQKDILKNSNITEELLKISSFNLYSHVKNNTLFFNNQNYNKLLIEENDDLEFYIITWNTNALSKLHSHNNECLFKVCIGDIEQTILKPTDNLVKKTEIIKPTEVKYINKEDFHQMRNISDDFAISFHIYDK